MTDKEYEAWREKHDKDSNGTDKAAQSPPKAEPVARPAPVTPPRDPLANVFGGAPAGIEMTTDGPVSEHVIEHELETPDEETLAAYEQAREKKTDAIWYVVVGVAMLFLSSFHWGVGVGGTLMVAWGAFRYMQWNQAAKAAYNPWDDSELDEWEEEEFGSS